MLSTTPPASRYTSARLTGCWCPLGRFVLTKSILLLEEMMKIAAFPRPPNMLGWLAPAMGSLEMMQCLTQGVPTASRKALGQSSKVGALTCACVGKSGGVGEREGCLGVFWAHEHVLVSAQVSVRFCACIGMHMCSCVVCNMGERGRGGAVGATDLLTTLAAPHV